MNDRFSVGRPGSGKWTVWRSCCVLLFATGVVAADEIEGGEGLPRAWQDPSDWRDEVSEAERFWVTEDPSVERERVGGVGFESMGWDPVRGTVLEDDRWHVLVKELSEIEPSGSADRGLEVFSGPSALEPIWSENGSVPEPASGVVLLLGAMWVGRRRRRAG